MASTSSRFNLVIERLLVSRRLTLARRMDCVEFQSRNREAFGFKRVRRLPSTPLWDSFNLVIKRLLVSRVQVTLNIGYPVSFNLVIERLLVSRNACMKLLPQDLVIAFQSRNREAFGFKLCQHGQVPILLFLSFNLVIERLLVSRCLRVGMGIQRLSGFNLVIERLLVSRSRLSLNNILAFSFQSRNREAFGFK